MERKILSAEKKQKRNLSVTTLKDSEFRFPGKEKKISSLYLQLSSRDCAPHKRLRFERENEGDDLFK